MAYRLALPPALSRVHKVFHVSMLRKYVPSPEHIWLVEDVVVDKKFTYEERPEKIVDRKDQVLRTRTIPYVLSGGISPGMKARPTIRIEC